MSAAVTQLHFDCFSGISGDMVLGAFVDAGLPVATLSRGMASLRAGRYKLRATKVHRAGIAATKVDVVITAGTRAPFALNQIRRLIASSKLPGWVKERGYDVFDRLAQAEGVAHRTPPTEIRFHEIGVVDSLVDVLGGLLGCHLMGVRRVTASPVNLGSGMMESAHGRLPVPGPAVAALAQGLPVYSAGPARELTTPTGLALVCSLTKEFGPMPLIRVKHAGYGAGTANPADWPNALRIFLGEPVSASAGMSGTVIQIETNLDDLNPQLYEAVVERLFTAGAIDVALTPVVMKRGRPGVVLTVLAPPENAEAAVRTIMKETTSLGVRMQEISRWVLPRHQQSIRTPSGVVRMKVSDTGHGDSKAAPEFSDCKRLADETGRPVREIMQEAVVAYAKEKRTTRRGRRGGSDR